MKQIMKFHRSRIRNVKFKHKIKAIKHSVIKKKGTTTEI